MHKLRTEETIKKLEAHQSNTSKEEYNSILHKAPVLKSFKYWNIINNDFPYDNIAEVHHLLVPKRHVDEEGDLESDEYIELLSIKKNLGTDYDSIIENLPSVRSIQGHYHLHLIKLIK